MVLCRKETLFQDIPPSEAERFKYRWIVLLSSFFVRTFVFGAVMSVGVLYVEWLEDFQLGLGDTALIGSIATGSVLLMGPVSSALLDRFSCRQVVIVSGLTMSAGLIVSSFSNGIPYLCITFGVVSGCAGGIANLAAIVPLSQYFDHQRPLAMGIGSSGVGIGIFMFGFLQKFFVSEYTWRGSLLVVGGILLHLMVCGLLMVPPGQLRFNRFLWNWKNQPASNPAGSSQESCSCPEFEFENEAHSTSKRFLDSGDSPNLGEDLVERCPTEENNEQNERVPKRQSVFQIIAKKMRITQKIVDLWKDPIFLILFVSDFLSWLIQFVPYVHLPKRAAMLGIPNGAVLISIMGLCNAVGKTFFGALCTFYSLSPFKVFIVAQTLLGLSTVLSPLCVTFSTLCTFAVAFGLLSGSYGLMMVIPAKLLGEDKFSLAYGFMLAGEGFGVYLGPPLVGWISDATESYNSSFFLAGCFLIASALVLLLHPILLMVRKRKRKIRHRQAWQ